MATELTDTFKDEASGGRSWPAVMMDPTGLKTAATDRILDSARTNTVYGDIERNAKRAANWVGDQYEGLSPGMQKWAMFGAFAVGARMLMGFIPDGTPFMGNPLAKMALALVVGVAGSGGGKFLSDIFASSADNTSPQVAAEAEALIGPPPPPAQPEVAMVDVPAPKARPAEFGAGMPS